MTRDDKTGKNDVNGKAKPSPSSEELLNALLKSAKDSIFIKNAERRYTMANQAMAKLWGIEVSDIAGKTDEELFGSEAEKTTAPADRAVLAGKTIHVTDALEVGDGIRVFDVTKTPTKNESGEVTGILGIARDVTEQFQADKAIRESEAKYRDLVEHSSDLICTHDLEGCLLSLNPAAEKMMKVPAESLVGRNLEEIILPRYREDFRTYLETIASTGKAEGIMRVKLPNGRERIWYYRNTLHGAEGGEAVVFGYARDVTERFQAEMQLRESEARFRALVDQAGDAIFVADLEGRILDVNPRACESLGYSRNELLSLTVADVDAKSVNDNFRQNTWSKLEPEKPVTVRAEHRRKDGSTFPVEVRIALISFHGQPAILGFARDITERKRTGSELHESRRMLQLVLDTIPVRVFWKDADSNYLGCNKPFMLDAGLSAPEEIIGKNDFEMTWKEQAGGYRADDRLVMESLEPKLNYEEPQTTPDGSLIWLRTSKVPLLDEEGNLKGVLGTYEDITDRKRAEEELRALNSELESRVEERTKDLRRTVNLMAGREIRMAELKEVVKRLREQIKEAGMEPVANDPLANGGGSNVE